MSTSTIAIAKPPFIPPPLSLGGHHEPIKWLKTLPEIADFNALHNPDHIFCRQARKSGPGTRLLDISHLALRDAVIRCQLWLLARLSDGKVPLTRDDTIQSNKEPIALFMESDVGLWIHILALLGLDFPVLLLSARLGPNPVKHLLEKVNVRTVLVSPRLKNTMIEGVELMQENKSVAIHERLPFESFLEKNPHFSTNNGSKAICAVRNSRVGTDTVIILHSSGTTGLPKPIYHPHEYLLGFATAHAFRGDAPRLNCSTLPLYHGFGLVAPCLSMSVGMTVCLPITNVTSGSAILELLELTGAESLMTVPSMLEDISLLSNNMWTEIMAQMKFVAFGGGPLKSSVGETLAAEGVALLNHYGATEVGALAPIFVPDTDYNYRYFRLRQDFNLELKEVERNDYHEKLHKLVAHPFGWSTPFEIQDNLVSNPAHPKTDFNAIGRNDDVIVLCTGEKVLPNIMESFLTESELCKVAIVFGENQFQVGVLIQPRNEVTSTDADDFRKAIWPVIELANELVDSHARILSSNAIAIVPPGKLVPRTDKGSIMRKEVYLTFEQEIAQVFENLEKEIDTSMPQITLDNLEEDIKQFIQTRLRWKVPLEQWKYDDDLFELGMDSLQALQLRRFISSATNLIDIENIPRDFVYQNPSISALANAIRGSESESLESEDRIETYCQRYVASEPTQEIHKHSSNGSIIVLTGSTGSLGSYLLAQLTNLASVERVICLNRPKSGMSPTEQVFSALRSKEIKLSAPAYSKIVAFQTNTSKPYLGLPENDYNTIRDSVTHIIHNAWPMDFNRRIKSFEGQFHALNNLIDLARNAGSSRSFVKPTLLFISSIATVGHYPPLYNENIVPEIPMANNQCADEFGYAKAKLVCERMIEGASKVWGGDLHAKYIRVGQITGAVETGLWNPTEHFPALVKSSHLVRALPQLKGTLSWLPVDKAATTVLDVLFSSSFQVVFHLENPIRQSWNDLLSIIARELGLEGNACMLSYEEWLAKVLAVHDDKIDFNPVKKLAGFFESDFERMARGEVVLDTIETRRLSQNLRHQQGVDEKLVRDYILKWRKLGFLVSTKA